MPPAYPRPYGRGISRAAPRMFFWKKRAPPRTHITVAIHPRAYARGILAHTSKTYPHCDKLPPTAYNRPMDTPTQKHVLIVEDDNVLAGMLKQSLEAAGFKVFHAKNGEEGRAAATEGARPDLLIVDIDMPKMDGVTMLKVLRAEGMNIPALMLTNFNQPEHVADAAETGILEYLVKADWEIDQIVEKVKSHLALGRTT